MKIWLVWPSFNRQIAACLVWLWRQQRIHCDHCKVTFIVIKVTRCASVNMSSVHNPQAVPDLSQWDVAWVTVQYTGLCDRVYHGTLWFDKEEVLQKSIEMKLNTEHIIPGSKDSGSCLPIGQNNIVCSKDVLFTCKALIRRWHHLQVP